MRTLIIIVSGLILFGICLLASRWLSAAGTAPALAAKIFIPLWLVAAAYNMWVGVSRAGYSVGKRLEGIVTNTSLTTTGCRPPCDLVVCQSQ
jgi:hypothetical protein